MPRHLPSHRSGPGGPRRVSAVLACALAGAAVAAAGGVPLSASAGAPTTGPIQASPCLLVTAHCPSEGPTVLEAGSNEVGDVPSDWVVTGYGYTPGDKYAVKIINAPTKAVLDSTSATAESNGTITAQSPVHYVTPPKGISLNPSGWVITTPLPTCGVTLEATLTDETTGTSQEVGTPACPPVPPPPK